MPSLLPFQLHDPVDLPFGAAVGGEGLLPARPVRPGARPEEADADRPSVETVLAGNIFHRHVLLGRRDQGRKGGRIDGLRARVARNGAAHADTTELEANTGKLVDIVRHVADVLAACGEQLSAGDVIIAGSVIAPIFVGSEDRALDYALDPIGSVAVRFAA